MDKENHAVLVELFGPLREYGALVSLPLDEAVPFSGLLNRLGERLGSDFREKALRGNITYILNDRVVDREAPEDPLIRPGDRVAFALLLGGG